MIFCLAGIGTPAAANAFFYIYPNAVPNIIRVFRFVGRKYNGIERLQQSGGKDTSTDCYSSR
jgi:hypothetical protein